MSTTTATTHVTPSGTTERRPVWKHGLAATAIAALATTTLAAVASAAGVSFADRSGDSIPIAAFAQFTVVFSLIGVLLAAILARKARRPRTTFVRTTTDFLNGYLKHRRSALRRLATDGTVAGATSIQLKLR